MEHAVVQLRRGVANADGPTQTHYAIELAITAFRAKIRNDSSSGWSALFLPPDSQLVVCQTNLDLLRRDSGQFDAQQDHRLCLAEIDRRRPRTRRQRGLCFSRFFQRDIKAAYAIAQSL